MNARKLLIAGLAGFYLLLWIGGVTAYITVGEPPGNARWTAPVFLVLAGGLILLTSARRIVARLLLAASIGMASELAGVHVGLPFGAYSYTEALSPLFFGVPIAMGAAWLVLVAYVCQIISDLPLPSWGQPVAAAIVMTAIDLVIDPLAAGPLGYWSWVASGSYYGIPATNFLGWFLVSLVIFGLLGRNWTRNSAAGYIGLSIILFFTIIAFSKGLLLAGAAGAGLAILHAVIQRRSAGTSEGEKKGKHDTDRDRQIEIHPA